MEIEVVTPKLNDTERREVHPEGNTSQIIPSTEIQNETVKFDLFETPMGGSTGESINTNTNNKSRSTKIPAPKVATQQKRDSRWQHPKRVKAKSFQIKARLQLHKILPNDDIKKEVRRE